MKNNLLLSLHEKAIAVLEAYYKAERMAVEHKSQYYFLKGHKWSDYTATDFHQKRLAINTAIMARLQAYYTRIIEKINQHKP